VDICLFAVNCSIGSSFFKPTIDLIFNIFILRITVNILVRPVTGILHPYAMVEATNA